MARYRHVGSRLHDAVQLETIQYEAERGTRRIDEVKLETVKYEAERGPRHVDEVELETVEYEAELRQNIASTDESTEDEGTSDDETTRDAIQGTTSDETFDARQLVATNATGTFGA